MNKSPNNTEPQAPTRSISFRLVIATLSYSLIVAIVVSSVQIYFAYQQLVTRAPEYFQPIDKTYAPELTNSLWEVNTNNVGTLLNNLSQLDYVGFVELVDTEGNRWHRNIEAEHIFASKTYPLIYAEGDINFKLGELRVDLSSETILQQLREKAISIAITSCVTLLLGSLFVLILFQKWVTQHLKTMSRYTQEMNINNLDKPLRLNRAPAKKVDELDQVVSAINEMRLTLIEDLAIREKIEQELASHRDNLEIIVQKRTEELVEKNSLLQDQSLALESQNRELDAYAHSVAHDLKNPLTTLIGLSSLLSSSKQNFDEARVKESLGIIHKTARKMADIIDALLLLASIRRHDEINPEVLDMKELAKDARQRLEVQINSHLANVAFVGTWQPAMGYKQWIENVWVNYLSNAIKYGGSPPVIEMGCERINEHSIKYWVRDHGPGIAASKRSELFIQFSRLDPAASEGHGLGLSIIKRIIQRLHGEVGYEDAPGGGSIFWFSLPSTSNGNKQPLVNASEHK